MPIVPFTLPFARRQGALTASNFPDIYPGNSSNMVYGTARRRRLTRGRQRQSRRMRFMQRRRKPGTRGKGVTTQHDQRMIYKKKSMPSSKKKPWKRFVRKVHAVSEKSLGAQTVVFNTSVESLNVTPNQHAFGTVALYSNKSTFTHLNDVYRIQQRHKSASGSTSAKAIADQGVTANVNDTSMFLFQSGVMDCTFRNISGNSVSSTLNSELTLEVDVYELAWNSPSNDRNDGEMNSIVDVFTRGFAATSSIGQQGDGMEITQRGVTPFECPQGLSQYKVKILKKTKYFLPNNGQFTYQIRDPTRHKMSGEKIDDRPGCNIPGVTKWLFYIAKTLPGIVLDDDKAEILRVGVTRKYMYKIRGEPSRRDYYVTG